MLARPWVWYALFAAYFGMQMVLRLLIGPALELDEAEAFFLARTLAPGYNAQPPLYFWLQWGVFQGLGDGILALALLKALLLGGTLAVLFTLLRGAVPVAAAGVAAASLALLPQVVWEAQRALTHSVLALFMSVCLLALVWRAVMRGGWGDYLAVGVAGGLTVLAKYNAALWPLALLLAAMASPDLRRRIRPERLAVAALVAAAVVAPHGLWLWENGAMGGAGFDKLGVQGSAALARLQGTGALVAALVAFVALALVVIGPAWWLRGGARPAPRLLAFMALAGAMALLVLWVFVLISGATAIKERWLLPVLWPVVPAALLWLWPQIGLRGRRWLGGGIAALWLVAMALLPWASLRDPGYRAADFGVLNDRLDPDLPVASDSLWLLGNLALIAPERRLVWGAWPEGPYLWLARGVEGAGVIDISRGLRPYPVSVTLTGD